MTTQVVEYSDLELQLKAYLAPGLAAWSADVDRKFPPTSWTPGHWVVVRNDGGPDLTLVTAQRRMGFTFIGADYKTTQQMAQRGAALLRALPGTSGLPIAEATIRGPYSLSTANRVEFYLTADLIVVGHSVTL